MGATHKWEWWHLNPTSGSIPASGRWDEEFSELISKLARQPWVTHLFNQWNSLNEEKTGFFKPSWLKPSWFRAHARVDIERLCWYRMPTWRTSPMEKSEWDCSGNHLLAAGYRQNGSEIAQATKTEKTSLTNELYHQSRDEYWRNHLIVPTVINRNIFCKVELIFYTKVSPRISYSELMLPLLLRGDLIYMKTIYSSRHFDWFRINFIC